MPSTAYNYLETSWDSGNTALLQKKASILLGLKSRQTASLTDTFVDRSLDLISGEAVEQTEQGNDVLYAVDPNEINLQAITLEEPTYTVEDMLFDEIAFLKTNSLSGPILRSGISIDNYRVLDTGEGSDFRLVLRTNQSDSWWNLASYGTLAEATTSANGLRRFLVRLSVESEGFHIVEHILLRPRHAGPHPPDIPVPDDFYSFTVSVFFSGWTARCHDEMFRRMAEETVQENCPAHIYPEFHWLDFQQMREFEALYRQWLEAKSAQSPDPVEIDSAAGGLIKFITQHRAEGSGPLEGSE